MCLGPTIRAWPLLLAVMRGILARLSATGIGAGGFDRLEPPRRPLPRRVRTLIESVRQELPATYQYGYELTLLSHPDRPPYQILPILRRLFQPDGRPVPDAQILSAMGLSSPSGLTSVKAVGLLGVKSGSVDAAAYLEEAQSSASVSPPASDLFAGGVYNRGAMAVQSLWGAGRRRGVLPDP